MWVRKSYLVMRQAIRSILSLALSFFILLLHKSGKQLGPVVQSIVSLTSSLRGQFVKCFTTL